MNNIITFMEFSVKKKRNEKDNVGTKGSLVCKRTISINNFFKGILSGDMEKPKDVVATVQKISVEMNLLAYGPSGPKGLSEKDAGGSCYCNTNRKGS